ncbi:hypothetical protein C6988_07030 [Nitrosopumilus sp. b1]|uniref:hypothetical protein n=1 Tax=Nitrosopumilus sp. b1 TaxID=2109907 RepID=UPI0015F49FB6|nr:hypothetical protein [Nitrosopumilus sp. b1]KAF6242915.1 hypothetical protein C6988_07030 [Nitrosopumilus sp. b1]
MSSPITELYNSFRKEVKTQIPPIEPDLAIKIMRIQRKLEKISPTRSKPHVNLYVKYKEGIEYQEKVDRIRDKYPIQASVSRWNDGIILSGLMSIDNVQTICSDPDITEVNGEANSRHN